jgi:hypothetical protein
LDRSRKRPFDPVTISFAGFDTSGLFLWGYVKERVFQEIPTTREDMMERIQQAFAAIRRETQRNVRGSFYSRIEKCVEVNGRNFEHLI